jgi:segregation and condensation protein B
VTEQEPSGGLVEQPPELPAEEPSELPVGDDAPELSAVLEALLLVTDEPVPATTLAAVAERPMQEVERALQALVEDYARAGRGFELRQVAGGWRLYTRADCAPYVERYVVDGQQARLTQAALETLAVIAYRQPVTRARVSAVRGVNVDGVVRTLLARGLIADAGQDPDSAGTLYRTTPLLLERLGISSLDELPPLAPLLPDLSELDDAATST